MPITPSPLRYPGGKSKLTEFVAHTLEINDVKNPVYCEPFCGGAGVAIKLILNKKASGIILNDYDIAIYSFWNAVLNDTNELLNAIWETPVTISERERQKEIYMSKSQIKKYDFELAFATLYLNRTNVSGVIKGGVIGGKNQKGKYKIDARFGKENIIAKIKKIATFKDKILLFNLDASQLVQDILLKMDKNSLFVFFDPPYYGQGKNLYTNFFRHQNHEDLGLSIKNMDDFFWIMTYDDEPKIYEIYKGYSPKRYKLQYSANVKIKETELFFNSPRAKIESFDRVVFE